MQEMRGRHIPIRGRLHALAGSKSQEKARLQGRAFTHVLQVVTRASLMGVGLLAVRAVVTHTIVSGVVGSGRVAAMPAVAAMYDSVPASPLYQPQVDREGRRERYRQRYGEAAPEQQARKPRVHCARDEQQDAVVHDLHHDD